MGQMGAIVGGIHGGTTARTTDWDKERRDRQYAIDTMKNSQWIRGMSPTVAIKEAPSSREAAYQGMMGGMSGKASPSSGSAGGDKSTGSATAMGGDGGSESPGGYSGVGMGQGVSQGGSGAAGAEGGGGGSGGMAYASNDPYRQKMARSRWGGGGYGGGGSGMMG